MKIIILQENLKEALTACGKAVASSSSLPILNSFLLRTKNGMLEVIATNLEMSVSHSARCKIEEDGEVCLQARSFQDLVASLGNEPITLYLQGNSLKLESGNVKTSLNTFQAQDFPNPATTSNSLNVSVESQNLARALHGTLFAVSTNETQAELCGVYVEALDGELVFAGTNRYRLAEMKVKIGGVVSSGLGKAILPARVVSELVRFSDAFTGQIKIGFGEGSLVAEIGNTKLTSRLIDGQYPDYKAIIPQNFKETIVLERSSFVSALKTMGVFARTGEGLKFSYSSASGNVSLSASSVDSGAGSVEVEAKISGSEGEVLFNYKYLFDVFAYLNSDKVTVSLNDNQSPVVVKPVGDESYMYLIMPIKT